TCNPSPAEAAMQDVPTKATAKPFKWVGTRPVRPDGVPKVTGRALYGADLAMPGMLVGRILRSPHAHARIRSIETSKAAALPGVKAVVTSADFPEQKFEFVGPERGSSSRVSSMAHRRSLSACASPTFRWYSSQRSSSSNSRSAAGVWLHP